MYEVVWCHHFHTQIFQQSFNFMHLDLIELWGESSWNDAQVVLDQLQVCAYSGCETNCACINSLFVIRISERGIRPLDSVRNSWGNYRRNQTGRSPRHRSCHFALIYFPYSLSTSCHFAVPSQLPVISPSPVNFLSFSTIPRRETGSDNKYGFGIRAGGGTHPFSHTHLICALR